MNNKFSAIFFMYFFFKKLPHFNGAISLVELFQRRNLNKKFCHITTTVFAKLKNTQKNIHTKTLENNYKLQFIRYIFHVYPSF